MDSDSKPDARPKTGRLSAAIGERSEPFRVSDAVGPKEVGRLGRFSNRRELARALGALRKLGRIDAAQLRDDERGGLP